MTALFVVIVRLPYAPLCHSADILCGLLPIVGNLISNVIIVCLAFTISFKLAVIALGFLVAIHKLEYFLNSKIIGDRIRNPIWLTLLALIIGERLMGIPGMVLAPVVLNYLRLELQKSRFQARGINHSTLSPAYLRRNKQLGRAWPLAVVLPSHWTRATKGS